MTRPKQPRFDASDVNARLQRGENIMDWVRSVEGSKENSAAAIAYSYDAQAGSYTKALSDPQVRELKERMGRRIAKVLDEFEPSSVLEAGVGEATSLAPTIAAMRTKPQHIVAFDISFSRLLFSSSNLTQRNIDNAQLFVGALERIPLADSSVDVVLTIHAVEPNRGREEVILAELLRVAARGVVMIEPSYELGGEGTKAHIDRFGYVRDLPGALKRLGFPASSVEHWDINANPQNEAAMIIVRKSGVRPVVAPRYISPISGKPLVRRSDCWYCNEDGHAFPIVSGIACLTSDNAILASKLGTDGAGPGNNAE